jgi:hypothetical protein
VTYPAGSRVMVVGPEASVGTVVRVIETGKVLVAFDGMGRAYIDPEYLVDLSDLDGGAGS